MKYTILFVIAALAMSIVFIACSSSKNNNIDDSSARKGEVSTNIDIKYLSNKWKHVKTKDSYDGIWKEVESDHRIITFSEEGKYTELNPGNDLCEGKYTTEGENLIVNHSCNKANLTYKVASLDEEGLVLSIQGRHGDVFYVYKQME